jgi:DNA invertase Pin-like site-specific DNA recombinase
MNTGTRVIGYTRVSTVEQGDSGAGLSAQRRAIEEKCRHRGWILVDIIEDVASGKSSARPGLTQALERIESGEALALVAAKLDRVSRSTIDFCGLLARSERRGWKLAVLDLELDTTTPAGELMATVIASVAQYERRMIGERTRLGMAAKKAAGTLKAPVGRSRNVPPDVERRIKKARRAGLSYAKIADQLNAEGIPGGQGGRWYASTVAKIASRPARQS